MPRVVRAGVPSRIPLVIKGLRFSPGIAFLLVVIAARSSHASASLPVIVPSPNGVRRTQKHQAIANTINTNYRDQAYINREAIFDPARFVFRQSVKGTVFQKDEMDKRYWHRDPELNNFYRSILNFDEGDEVLQIGQVGVLTPLKYFWKKTVAPKLRNKKSGMMRPAIKHS